MLWAREAIVTKKLRRKTGGNGSMISRNLRSKALSSLRGAYVLPTTYYIHSLVHSSTIQDDYSFSNKRYIRLGEIASLNEVT